MAPTTTSTGATPATRASNAAVLDQLPFGDDADHE
jgi:hypothetical protein